MRKDTHCSDKPFGNLPPYFRSLAFFLGSMTVRELGTGKCEQMVQKFPGIPVKARKGITFFPKTFHRDEPFHLNSPQNYRKFHSNGKRSRCWRAFLKTPENFSGPKTLRGAFWVLLSGPEKCFSEHPKVSRIVSRYFRESFRVRAGKIILEHGFFFITTLIFSS